MQVQIKFKRGGSNSVYGSFEAGDLMRCDKDVAEHFVSEGLAVYTGIPAKAEVAPPAETTKRGKNKNRGDSGKCTNTAPA